MKLAIVAALLLIPAQLEARPKHWYKDWKWWAGEAVIAAAIAADAHSTASRPPGYIESNWAFGRNPSNRRVAGISLGYFGIQTALHAGAWHFSHHVPTTDPQIYVEDRLGWRIFGYAGVPATVAIINGRAAVKNYKLR